MPTPASFARIFVNGFELTYDATTIDALFACMKNAVQPQNIGAKQYSVGPLVPTMRLSGYEKHGMGKQSAHNVFSPHGIGNVNDIEFFTTIALGMNTSPVQGDACVLMDGTLLDYKRPTPIKGLLGFDTPFRSRGKPMPPWARLLYDNTAIKTTTNFSSNPLDDGSQAASGTSLGAVVLAHCYSPTGVVATGSVSLTGQPGDGDTFTLTIGGVAYVYVFKTALTPTASQVLIGANTAATIANLFSAMTNSGVGSIGYGVNYAAGTVAIPQSPLSTALVTVSVPNASNVINLTALATGTAANAYTLVATVNVSTKLAVSGATMAGGVAGDTYSLTVGSSTTSGGAYTTFATINPIGAVQGAFYVAVAVGTLINEWLKATITLVSGPGTSQTFAGNVAVGRFWQL